MYKHHVEKMPDAFVVGSVDMPKRERERDKISPADLAAAPLEYNYTSGYKVPYSHCRN
jgi:hypothetical protein